MTMVSKKPEKRKMLQRKINVGNTVGFKVFV